MSDLPPLPKGFVLDGEQQASAAVPPLPNGFTLDAQPEQSGVLSDVAKSAGIGVVKGSIGLAGLPGDVAAFLGDARDKYISNPISRKLGLSEVDLSGTNPASNLGASSIQKGIESATGEFYNPKTTAGEYAQTIGEFAPAALAGPGGIARRLVTQAIVPAVTSETAGQVTKGTGAEPYARFAGAMAGPLAVAAGRRAITPLPASAERQAMADVLQNEGVNLTAGQRTGSRPLQWMESSAGDMPLSGGRTRAMMDAQGEQFTAAALRRVGEDATRASPEVIDRSFRRIGNEFDTLAARNAMTADQQLLTDVRNVVGEYGNLVAAPNQTPAIRNFVRELANVAQRNNGVIPGATYQSLRSRMERVARGLGNNPEAMHAVRGLREAVDDGMERSLQAAGNTGDLHAWREARRQYRNMLVVEKAATGAGENAALGLISPSQLRNATVVQNRRAYARGQGDFADLARAGEALMKPLPQSGTAPRSYAMAVPAILGSGFAGGPAGMMASGAATLAPGLVGRLLMSRPAQAYLGNQAVLPPDALTARLRQLMLAGPAAVQATQPPR